MKDLTIAPPCSLLRLVFTEPCERVPKERKNPDIVAGSTSYTPRASRRERRVGDSLRVLWLVAQTTVLDTSAYASCKSKLSFATKPQHSQ